MRELYEMIFNLPPKSFTLVAVALGFILIDDLTYEEQYSLANFFMMIGQVLETNSAQQQLFDSCILNKKIENIQNKMYQMERDLSQYKNNK